jgi:hypothetical protein
MKHCTLHTFKKKKKPRRQWKPLPTSIKEKKATLIKENKATLVPSNVNLLYQQTKKAPVSDEEVQQSTRRRK